jgi:hypothetical protein
MAHGKAAFVRHAFRADSDLVTRAGRNTPRQPARVSNEWSLRRRTASESQAADAWARCSAYAGEVPAPDSKGQNNDFRDAEADPTITFAATKTVERLDLQALHHVRERFVERRYVGRFTPDSRHWSARLAWQKSARTGVVHRSKRLALFDHLVGVGEHLIRHIVAN